MLPASGTSRKGRVPYIISGKRPIIQTLFREYYRNKKRENFCVRGNFTDYSEIGSFPFDRNMV